MVGRVGIIWDTPVMFTRLVEDCGYISELITPHLLAAPFFRRHYSGIIIPGGFAHSSCCLVLPALRACEDRIWRYIQGGGTVLAFGAGADKPDAYDWLPVSLRYRFGFNEGEAVSEGGAEDILSCITEDCSDIVSIDGIFETSDDYSSALQSASDDKGYSGPVIALQVRGSPVMVEYRSGTGRIILTTLHEYPSRSFLTKIFPSDSETLL